jgi:hypothetical protein
MHHHGCWVPPKESPVRSGRRLPILTHDDNRAEPASTGQPNVARTRWPSMSLSTVFSGRNQRLQLTLVAYSARRACVFTRCKRMEQLTCAHHGRRGGGWHWPPWSASASSAHSPGATSRSSRRHRLRRCGGSEEIRTQFSVRTPCFGSTRTHAVTRRSPPASGWRTTCSGIERFTTVRARVEHLRTFFGGWSVEAITPGSVRSYQMPGGDSWLRRDAQSSGHWLSGRFTGQVNLKRRGVLAITAL